MNGITATAIGIWSLYAFCAIGSATVTFQGAPLMYGFIVLGLWCLIPGFIAVNLAETHHHRQNNPPARSESARHAYVDALQDKLMDK